MSEQINSVDFWVEELTHDINPEHFNHHENFISYMHDEKISSFGNWMWNNGYNVGLVNLQTKVNTYCVPPTEPKTAVWIDKSCWEFGGKFKQCIYQCSNCGYEVRHDPFTKGDGRGGKYCDDCGARMSKE